MSVLGTSGTCAVRVRTRSLCATWTKSFLEMFELTSTWKELPKHHILSEEEFYEMIQRCP